MKTNEITSVSTTTRSSTISYFRPLLSWRQSRKVVTNSSKSSSGGQKSPFKPLTVVLFGTPCSAASESMLMCESINGCAEVNEVWFFAMSLSLIRNSSCLPGGSWSTRRSSCSSDNFSGLKAMTYPLNGLNLPRFDSVADSWQSV